MALPHNIEKLAVIGAGQMGHGVAQVSLPVCETVLLKDVSLDAVSKGMTAVYRGLDKLVEKKKLSKFQRDALYGRMLPCDDYRYFVNTDLVLEAVVEDLGVKKKVLAEVEAATGERTIFATNTSALPIGSIAENCSRPENVIGMHYFSPVPLMPLLEIIAADRTAVWVKEAALKLGELQKKKCIVVKDGPAFYTTRILMVMLNQAGILAEEGVDPYAVDRALVEFGFPVGPITLLDEVGIDTAFHVSEMMRKILDPRKIAVTGCFRKLNAKGFAGRKAGKGFFDYGLPKEGEKKRLNREALDALGVKGDGALSAAEIQNRVALTMVNEAAACLQEGIISSPGDGDTGATLGLGFPMQKGGPFRYLDSEGAGAVVNILEELQTKRGPAFAPSAIIKEMAAGNRKFYS